MKIEQGSNTTISGSSTKITIASDNTEYDLYKEYKGTCPNANQYSKELITLPIHLDLSDEDITYISNKLKSIINE